MVIRSDVLQLATDHFQEGNDKKKSSTKMESNIKRHKTCLGNIFDNYMTGDAILESAFAKGKQNVDEKFFGEANGKGNRMKMEGGITVRIQTSIYRRSGKPTTVRPISMLLCFWKNTWTTNGQ